jgi:hypothetical protein
MTQLFLTLFLASRAGREDCAAVNRRNTNQTTMKTEEQIALDNLLTAIAAARANFPNA